MTHATERPTKTKHWTIWDSQKKELMELTHAEFKEGLENNWIKLRGDYFPIGSQNKKVWIDGIINN